jgi:hypothetical protein
MLLFSADKGSSAETPAVCAFIKILLASCKTRPAAIMIDKSDAERKGVTQAVAGDAACWLDGQQIAAILLLCEYACHSTARLRLRLLLLVYAACC